MIYCSHWKIIYLWSVYYFAYLPTLYYPVRFVKVPVNAKSAVKCSLEREQFAAKGQRDLKPKKKKWDDPEKKKTGS